jgi:hypothetical protein
MMAAVAATAVGVDIAGDRGKVHGSDAPTAEHM